LFRTSFRFLDSWLVVFEESCALV